MFSNKNQNYQEHIELLKQIEQNFTEGKQNQNQEQYQKTHYEEYLNESQQSAKAQVLLVEEHEQQYSQIKSKTPLKQIDVEQKRYFDKLQESGQRTISLIDDQKTQINDFKKQIKQFEQNFNLNQKLVDQENLLLTKFKDYEDYLTIEFQQIDIYIQQQEKEKQQKKEEQFQKESEQKAQIEKLKQEEIDQKNKEIENQKTKINDLEKEIEFKTECFKNLQDQNQQIKQNIQEKEKLLCNKCEDTEQCIKLQSEINSLSKKVSEQEEKCAGLKKLLIEVNEKSEAHKKSLQDLSVEFASCKLSDNLSAKLKECISKLIQEETNLYKQDSKLFYMNEELKKQIKMLTLENQDLKNRVTVQKAIISEKNSEIQNLQVEKQKLSSQINDLKKELEQANVNLRVEQMQQTQNKERIQELEQKLETIQKEIDTLLKKKKECKQEILDEQNVKDKMIDEQKRQQNQMEKTLENKNQILEQQMIQLRNQKVLEPCIRVYYVAKNFPHMHLKEEPFIHKLCLTLAKLNQYGSISCDGGCEPYQFFLAVFIDKERLVYKQQTQKQNNEEELFQKEKLDYLLTTGLKNSGMNEKEQKTFETNFKKVWFLN